MLGTLLLLALALMYGTASAMRNIHSNFGDFSHEQEDVVGVGQLVLAQTEQTIGPGTALKAYC